MVPKKIKNGIEQSTDIIMNHRIKYWIVSFWGMYVIRTPHGYLIRLSMAKILYKTGNKYTYMQCLKIINLC